MFVHTCTVYCCIRVNSAFNFLYGVLNFTRIYFRRSLTTSFLGFSPTRPSLRRVGRREPWERGWVFYFAIFLQSRKTRTNKLRTVEPPLNCHLSTTATHPGLRLSSLIYSAAVSINYLQFLQRMLRTFLFMLAI